MSRRRPTKAERERVISLDLLADWRAYAEPLPVPGSEHAWRYFGTITMDGQSGAFAWRAGGYGIGNGSNVRQLGVWDQIKITSLLAGHPSGHAVACVPIRDQGAGIGVTTARTSFTVGVIVAEDFTCGTNVDMRALVQSCGERRCSASLRMRLPASSHGNRDRPVLPTIVEDVRTRLALELAPARTAPYRPRHKLPMLLAKRAQEARRRNRRLHCIAGIQ